MEIVENFYLLSENSVIVTNYIYLISNYNEWRKLKLFIATCVNA